jgi:hypothetical protein
LASRAWRAAALAAAATVAIGCTAPSAIRQMLYAEEPLEKPPLVLVYDFAVDPHDVVVDVFGPAFLPEPGERAVAAGNGRDVANLLAAAMVEKLRARGMRAERAGARTTPPREAVLVKGQFVTVEGSAETPHMKLGVVGGKAPLRVQVQSYQVTELGLSRIHEREVGGQGAPAAASPDGSAPARTTTSAVISGGLNFVLRSQENVEADIDHLAELFAERAYDFYQRQGWL